MLKVCYIDKKRANIFPLGTPLRHFTVQYIDTRTHTHTHTHTHAHTHTHTHTHTQTQKIIYQKQIHSPFISFIILFILVQTLLQGQTAESSMITSTNRRLNPFFPFHVNS